jgi:hypothetical protein
MTSPNGKVICVANVACEGNDGGGTACDQKYCTQPDACANDTTVTNGPGGDITDDEITRAIKQNLGVSVSGPASPGGADATATPAN